VTLDHWLLVSSLGPALRAGRLHENKLLDGGAGKAEAGAESSPRPACKATRDGLS